jgi:hypothetical protein
VRLYTVHAEPARPPGIEGWPEPKSRPPVLLREGFSIYPFIFGFLWFAAKKLWWEALGLLVLTVAVAWLLPAPADTIALFALQVLAGMEGRDRLRARLARQGLEEQGVIAAPDLDLAWFRLGQQRPDLVKAMP